MVISAEVELEVQATSSVMSAVEPSLKMPVACNCIRVFAAMDRLDGEMEMEASVAGVTRRFPPDCAALGACTAVDF